MKGIMTRAILLAALCGVYTYVSAASQPITPLNTCCGWFGGGCCYCDGACGENDYGCKCSS